MIGIDEAGYGPILGPLVVSAAGYEVPDENADACLWDVLDRSVTRSAARRDARVAILDSKRLYQRKKGLGRLERSVLSAVGAWRGAPPTLRDLCEWLCPDVLDAMTHYPWYRGANPSLPAAALLQEIRLPGTLLKVVVALLSYPLVNQTKRVGAIVTLWKLWSNSSFHQDPPQ